MMTTFPKRLMVNSFFMNFSRLSENPSTNCLFQNSNLRSIFEFSISFKYVINKEQLTNSTCSYMRTKQPVLDLRIDIRMSLGRQIFEEGKFYTKKKGKKVLHLTYHVMLHRDY